MDLKDIGGFVDRLKEAEGMVGGKYQVSSLVQKRSVELMRGAPPLVDLWTNDLAEIALREVLGGKIELIAPEIGPEDTL